jgi:hypothetical protein
MIGILAHFEKSQKGSYKWEILKLKPANSKQLQAKLPISFRRCYVTDRKLRDNLSKMNISVAELIRNYIPDKKNIMSAEFGEILSFFLLKERCHPLNLLAPKKWFWKIDRNRPIQYTDDISSHENGEA